MRNYVLWQQADLGKMQMMKPYMGAIRRNYNPGVWFAYRKSRNHMSLHAKIQKIQVNTWYYTSYWQFIPKYVKSNQKYAEY